MPRIVMLRQFRTATHVGAAVARLIVAHPEGGATGGDQRTGYIATTQPPRDEQTPEERARRDAETNDILRQLKEAQ